MSLARQAVQIAGRRSTVLAPVSDNAALAARCLSTSTSSSSSLSSSSASSSSSSTLDSESVSHFSRLSASWWNPVGEFSLLHAMNPIRLDFMRQKLQEVGEWQETKQLVEAKQRGERSVTIDRPWEKSGQWLANVKALDVGCGGGLLSESLARVGADVLGIDASLSNVEIAKVHAARDPGFGSSSSPSPPPSSSSSPSTPTPSGNRRGPTYRHILAEDLLSEVGPNQFDVVCAMEVIEHVAQPRLFLQTLADLVKPGGHLFMSTIARTPLSHFLTIFMAEHVLRLVTPGTHRHDQYINPSELVEHFKSDIPWIHQQQQQQQQPGGGRAASRNDLPNRLQFETRGAFYIPGLGKWYLADRGMDKYGSELSNYFFWVRKPEETPP